MRLIDKLSPGRGDAVRPPNDPELGVTGVVRLPIAEGSAKIRSDLPAESELDAGWDVWTGTVPVSLGTGTPRAARPERALPTPALPAWLKGRQGGWQ